MENKVYSSAPLPFMGQKRRFVSRFKKALTQFPQAKIFVDLFGGSGLLSHITKRTRPDARVIYNDFDDYHIRLQNINRTNEMLGEIRKIVKNSGCPTDKKLPQEIKTTILKYLEKKEKEGYVDYITLSSSLLFSMKYAQNLEFLRKSTMYNSVRSSAYEAKGYLDGLEIVKYDYKKLFAKYAQTPDVVFFVDPPYLSTETGVYRNYWNLADYLDVLNVLKGTSYIYFTSSKSSILELCQWLETNLDATNPFRNTKRKEMEVRVNYSASYTDIMLYKQNYVSTTTGDLTSPGYHITTT
jgi:site-specific DNA-adenine methylase